MGLLAREDGDSDYDAICKIAVTICRLWEPVAADYGFQVYISPTLLRACCKEGSDILDEYFPKPPGPFKRIATLVVMARLYPFFHFGPGLAPEKSQQWLAKMVGLLVPVGLAKMRVNLTPDKPVPTWQSLDAWKGFPSLHFKMEFLQFVEGMDNYAWLEKIISGNPSLSSYRDKLITPRIARMIASTAMTIEACYYWNEEARGNATSISRLRGRCTDFFDLDDLAFRKEFDYDTYIFKASQRRVGRP